jgi:hypothetical protein
LRALVGNAPVAAERAAMLVRVLSQSFTSSSATPCPARSAARASATRRKNAG